MILPVHTSLLRIETIRILLATGHEKTDIADKFNVSRQAIYAAIDRFDLGAPLRPIDRQTAASAPYLQIATSKEISNKLLDARIIETLLGRA